MIHAADVHRGRSDDVAVGERRSVWAWDADAIRRVATALIVLQAVWRAWIALQGYFVQDDFDFAYQGATRSIDPSYLFQDHLGHLMPGALLLIAGIEHVAPLNYNLVVGVDLALQAAVGYSVYRLLRLLFGVRKGILVPLAFFLFSSLTLDAFLWWAAALNYLPSQLGVIWAIYCHVQYTRTKRIRWLSVAVLCWVLGLAFFEKALLAAPLMFAITLIGAPQKSLGRAVLRVTRTYLLAWCTYLAVAVAYRMVYLHYVHYRLDYSPDPPSVVQLAGKVIGTTVVPGLVGGPWHWQPSGFGSGAAAPPAALRWVAWDVVLVVIGVTLLLRQRAARVWLMFGGYLACDIALLALGRVGWIGPVIGLAYRYVADAAIPAALALAFIIMGSLDERGGILTAIGDRLKQSLSKRSWMPIVGAALLINAYVFSAIYTTQQYAPLWGNNPARPWVEQAKQSLRTSQASALLDEPVPADVLPAIFFPLNGTSHVLEPLRERPEFSDHADTLWMFDQTGKLVRGRVQGVGVADGPAPNCGYAVTAEHPGHLPLPREVFPWAWTIHIGYLAGADTPARITFGDDTVSLRLQKGLHDLFVMTSGGGSWLDISGLDPDVGLCVDTVTVGLRYPVPPETP